MRRMVRIGLMATAATAVFFYLTASYALHHPESLLTQCVVTSFHLGTEHNPFFKMGQSVGRTVYQVSQATPTDCDSSIEEEDQPLCVPADTPETSQPEKSMAVSPERREFIIQSIKEHFLLQPEASKLGMNNSGPFISEAFGREPPLCTSAPSEDESFPDFMPPCGEELPAVMNDGASKEAEISVDPLFKFWLGLFESAAKEAGEMVGIEAQEETHYFHDEEPPQCLEDPAYQHQYPGCPFTGNRQGSDHSSSPKMIDPLPSAKSKSIKKPSGTEMNSDGKTDPVFRTFDPKKYELPARLRQLLPGDSTEGEEEGSHPEVDTTEFRPTDGRPGEFDPKRM